MNAKSLMMGAALAVALVSAAAAQQGGRRADPLAKLPAAVTMVMQDGLMLLEEEFGVTNARTLKVGDEYRDGWKLEAVTGASATLKRGAETRTVNFERRGGAADQLAAEAEAAAKINLSNAVAGERPKGTSPVERARIQAAIASGDAKGVLALGGTAKDVAQALGGPLANMLASGGEASFVNLNGQAGVRVLSQDEQGRSRNMVMVPPQLAGVAAPPEAEVVTPPPMGPGAQVVSDGAGNTMVRQVVPPPAAQ